MPNAGKLLTGGTGFREDLSAMCGVAFQCQDGTIGVHDFLAIGIEGTGEEFGCASPHRLRAMLQKPLPMYGVDFESQNLLFYYCLQHRVATVRAAQHAVHNSCSNSGTGDFPATKPS